MIGLEHGCLAGALGSDGDSSDVSRGGKMIDECILADADGLASM